MQTLHKLYSLWLEFMKAAYARSFPSHGGEVTYVTTFWSRQSDDIFWNQCSSCMWLERERGTVHTYRSMRATFRTLLLKSSGSSASITCKSMLTLQTCYLVFHLSNHVMIYTWTGRWSQLTHGLDKKAPVLLLWWPRHYGNAEHMFSCSLSQCTVRLWSRVV